MDLASQLTPAAADVRVARPMRKMGFVQQGDRPGCVMQVGPSAVHVGTATASSVVVDLT